jgi:hypothetical protein
MHWQEETNQPQQYVYGCAQLGHSADEHGDMTQDEIFLLAERKNSTSDTHHPN